MEDRDGLGGLEDPVAGLLGALFVRRLRLRHGDGNLDRVAELTGFSVRTLQRYEKGQAVPPPKTLALLAQKAGVSRRLLDRLQKTLQADRLTEAGRLGGGPGSPRLEVTAAALEAVEDMAGLLAVEPAPAPWEDTGKPRPEDRLRADELWRRFLGQSRDQRYRLVRESSAFHVWSFAERLCHESEAAAADSPGEALELARLALEVARNIKGTASWHARMEAYPQPFVGNALRVCNELNPARAAFAEARKLQSAFSPDDPRLLDESRLPDREASLCREERNFREALALHEEALALSPVERRGPILLNKSFTLEQMGSYDQALATLKEAEPHILATGLTRNLFGLRFNTVVCLLHLNRADQAEELLEEIEALAEQLGKALDRLRTRWLAARVAAGQGRTDEAVTILDRVCEDFLRCDPPLPYDAALAGLDLARYWLQEGNTAAVQGLAVPLERIFRAKGIDREAAAALRLFCEAARREAVTVEMVRKVEAAVGRAGRAS